MLRIYEGEYTIMRIRESFMITPFKLNSFLFLCFALAIIFYPKHVLSADSKKTDNKPAITKAQSLEQTQTKTADIKKAESKPAITKTQTKEPTQTKAIDNKKAETKPSARMSQAMLTAATAALEAEKAQLAAKQAELDAAVSLQHKAKAALENEKALLAASQERLDQSLAQLDSSFSTLEGMYVFFCLLAIVSVGLAFFMYRSANKTIKSAVENLDTARRKMGEMPLSTIGAPENRPIDQHNDSEAEILLNRLKTYEDEIGKFAEEFRELSLKTPPSSEGKRRLAEYSKKLDILELFSNRSLSPRDYLNRGMESYFNYKYNDSLTAFDKAIELKPDYSKAWQSKALTLLRLGRLDDALRACDKVIVLYPNDPDSWYNKAALLALMSRKEEACLNLKKALEKDKKYKAVAKKDEDFKAYWSDAEFLSALG